MVRAMILDQLKQAGLKFATSPQAMKLMSNPKVQQALMKLLQLPNDVRTGVQKRTGQFAQYADLVTRTDMQQLNRMVRDLERELRRLQRQVQREEEKLEAAKEALKATGGGNGDAAATAEEAPKKAKKGIKVKRKIKAKKKDDPAPEAAEKPKKKKAVKVKRAVKVKKKDA